MHLKIALNALHHAHFAILQLNVSLVLMDSICLELELALVAIQDVKRVIKLENVLLVGKVIV